MTVDEPNESQPGRDAIERAWVEGTRSGDAAAFEHLFREYCRPLIRFARRIVGGTETAENVVQDVFLKVWEKRAHLDPERNIKTYLYTAVRNRSLKHIRHLDVQRRTGDHALPSPARTRDPDSELAGEELATAIDDAIASLPSECRMIFSMNRFDHLTYAEIAAIQEISIKTVETQMGRALKFLRQRLASFLGNSPR